MNKSINDLQAQVERVLVLVEERGGWRNAHGYDEQMMCKVLAWVAQSIMLRTKLGVEGDPLEIPRRLYTEMQRIIGKRTQGVLF